MYDVNTTREDLDAFGGHIPVHVQTHDGRRFQVEHIDSGSTPDGGICAVIHMGPRVESED